MQYQNYLPYATSTESPSPGLTSAFSFSLKEKKKKKDQEGRKKQKQKQKNPNPNTSEHFGTKEWHLQETIFLPVNCLGSKERLKATRNHHSARTGVPTQPQVPSALLCPLGWARVGEGVGGESIPSDSQLLYRLITLFPSRERGGQKQERGGEGIL